MYREFTGKKIRAGLSPKSPKSGRFGETPVMIFISLCHGVELQMTLLRSLELM
jgi:hypothetical protein